MPLYPPRDEPVKKKEQLVKKIIALQQAIRNNATGSKLIRVAEKYRMAQLAYLKAKAHIVREKKFQNKAHEESEKSEDQLLYWTNTSIEEIIAEFKAHPDRYI